MFGVRKRLGIDLGTANTIIYIENKGIALREPSIVAKEIESDKIIAFGKEAQNLQGRTSDKYEIIRPMQEGVIANFGLTKQMLAHYIRQAVRKSWVHPEVVICVPSNITKVERRAVIDAIKELGIRRAMIVDEPFAAAMGANLNINLAKGRMVIDIGGGTTDIAAITFGEIVNDYTSLAAGNRMNEAIQAYVREYYQLAISIDEAEQLKIQIGNAQYTEADQADSLMVKGRNVVSGLPDQVEVSAEVVAKALDEVIQMIVNAVIGVLEITAPELSADILETGLIMTGGGSLLKRLPERISHELGLPVHLASQPMDCVAIGAGKMLQMMQEKSKIAEKNARS